MLRPFLATFAALAAIAFHAPAMAQDGLTDAEVSGAIEQLGLEGERTQVGGVSQWKATVTSTEGQPYEFYIQPNLCDAATERCKVFYLYANFAPGSTVDDALVRRAIAYNERNLFGRVFVRDDVIGIDYTVAVDGNADADYFARRLADFPTIMANFITMMRTGSAAPAAR